LNTAAASRHSTSSRFRPTIARWSRPESAGVAAAVGAALLGLLFLETVMAEECPLSGPLVRKDLQSGFAGETGNVWTIAPDCSFTVARQIGLNVLDPYKRGQLTAQQQTELREMMGRVSATALPEQIGAAPQANARRITLSYGDRQSVLSLPPGGGDINTLRAAAGDDPTRLMLDLADKMKSMTGG